MNDHRTEIHIALVKEIAESTIYILRVDVVSEVGARVPEVFVMVVLVRTI